MQHWWWWFMLTRIVLCKEDIPYGITEYKSQDYLNIPSTDPDEPDAENWKERSIFDLQVEEIPNHVSWENKRIIEYVNDEIPQWGVKQHFEFPYSESKRSFKFLPNTKDYVLSNNFRELHYPEIEIKRVKPAFSSWGGKRSPAWGGKRKPAFSSWGGKRSPSFSSWGGKRYAPSYSSEQQPILVQGWDENHTKNSSTLNTNNPQHTENMSDEINTSDMSHQFQNTEDKQTNIPNWGSKRAISFSSWGGKRATAFSSWGGKRNPTSSDEVNIKTFPLIDYLVESPEGLKITDYKDNSYKLNEGSLIPDKQQILTNKRTNTYSDIGTNENLFFPTSGGKRIPAFSSWGGKRATAFSSWGGKRAPVFSSWGGKRYAEEEDKNIHLYNNHQELPLVNDESEQVPVVPPNIVYKENVVHPLELLGKRSETYPFVKVKLYPAFSSTGGKRGKLVANEINRQTIPTLTNWDNKRSPVLSSWYSNSIQTFPKSGKRRPVFSSWGGKRSLDVESNVEKTVTSSGEKDIQPEHIVYKRAADTEEYSTKQDNDVNDETKFYTRVMKQLNHETRNAENYLPKDILIKEKKGCMTNKNLLDLSKGIFSICGTKRTQLGETKRVFQKMLLRGNGFKDITWPTIRSNSRGADFYAWGGKRSFSQ